MPIVCVGLSHRTAPLSARELLWIEPSRRHAVLASGTLHAAGRRCGLDEFALLSTCNRTEVYAATSDPALRFDRLPDGGVDLLASVCHTPARLQPSHCYHKVGSAALEHLCIVAAGLDSMVPGESEVLGQVAEARQVAVAAGSSGPTLDAAFRTAVRAGRRARAETAIGQRPASVASEGIRWMGDRFGSLADAHVLIVGTGRVARVAAEILRSRGVRDLVVAGRTHEHARDLSNRLGAATLPWHGLAAGIQQADIVLATTAAPHTVISRDLVADVLTKRAPCRRLLFADLAVPRDVERGVADLPGVELMDLDQLQTRVEANLLQRSQEIPGVRSIIEEEMAHFEMWQSNARIRPVLTRLHHRAEAIRQQEVDRVLARMPAMDPESRECIEALSRSLVARILASPSRRLRAEPDAVRSGEWSAVLAVLFGLDQSSQADVARAKT
jgi:glutamyl-tRNA reductase